MRHMAQHDSGVIERTSIVKGEPGDADSNYVVVEVFQDGTEEQYEDEVSELELEDEEIDEEMETIVEESENYTLEESKI